MSIGERREGETIPVVSCSPHCHLLEKDSKDSLPLSAGSSHCVHLVGPCCSEHPQQCPRGHGGRGVEKLQVIIYLYGFEALKLPWSLSNHIYMLGLGFSLIQPLKKPLKSPGDINCPWTSSWAFSSAIVQNTMKVGYLVFKALDLGLTLRIRQERHNITLFFFGII